MSTPLREGFDAAVDTLLTFLLSLSILAIPAVVAFLLVAAAR